ncbi:Ulp1 protease family, carboxy-terminal domain protein [Arachis hypogaea]|nr:Ulp1 protease family, carboxy-terminal domain protein [Arachis hypogaea]
MLKEQHSHKYKGKKRVTSTPTCSMDGADDPTYIPTTKIEFSMDHMPFRSTRAKKKTRQPRRGPKTQDRTKKPELVDLTTEYVGHGEFATPPSQRDMECNVDDDRCYNIFPLGCSGGKKQMPDVMLVKLDRIPKGIDLAFSPTKEMRLFGIDLVAATYVFSNDLPPRKAAFTLVPKEKLIDDVLDVVVTMLSHTSPSYLWFLPITIMGTLATIKEKHMPSKVNKVHRIYVPMWTIEHWYLMIIDNVRRKLMYLDLLVHPEETENRQMAMTKVALYLESITLGQAWLSSNDGVRPRFSTYDIEDANVLQQTWGSIDCRVWVSQWMIRGALWKYYDVWTVNVVTRIWLTIDLVLKEHNGNEKALVAKAMSH